MVIAPVFSLFYISSLPIYIAGLSISKVCSAEVQYSWKTCCCHSCCGQYDYILRSTRAEATDLANAVLDDKLWILQITF
jgi:hypothetical protein